MNGLGDSPVDQTSRPYGTAHLVSLPRTRSRLTSTFPFEFQPILSDGSDFGISLDLDSITLEFALGVFSQVSILLAMYELGAGR
jgi:hypothetical protein